VGTREGRDFEKCYRWCLMEAQTEVLAEVLQSVGVLDWLRSQFPSMSDDELLSTVQDDFESIVGGLATKNPPAWRREGVSRHGNTYSEIHGA